MIHRMAGTMAAGLLAAACVAACQEGTSGEEKTPPISTATPAHTPTSAVPPPAADAGEIPEPPDPGPAPRELWEEALKPTVTDEELKSTLIVMIEADVESGPAPLTVTFACNLLEEQVKSPSFVWNFGDGTPAVAAASPTHTYTRPGTYVARVVVTDASGNRGTDEVEIEVEESSDGRQAL